MSELLYENATITWKTPKNIMSMSNVDIYDDGKAYYLSFEQMRKGAKWQSSKRVWKKNVISIKS